MRYSVTIKQFRYNYQYKNVLTQLIYESNVVIRVGKGQPNQTYHDQTKTFEKKVLVKAQCLDMSV